MCTWPTSSLGWETWRAGLKFIRLDRIKKHDRFGRVPNPISVKSMEIIGVPGHGGRLAEEYGYEH